MIINNVRLAHVAGSRKQLPEDALPEIVMMGKSNVGKSSLINCMLGRKNLARTSSTPGKTQTINFYLVENKLYFVDLPGYGYASVSKEKQSNWGEFVDQYLADRPQIRLYIQLIDMRHELGTNDRDMVEYLSSYNLPTVYILTKSDKMRRKDYEKQLAYFKKTLPVEEHCIIPFSSVTKEGREASWEQIMKHAGVGL